MVCHHSSGSDSCERHLGVDDPGVVDQHVDAARGARPPRRPTRSTAARSVTVGDGARAALDGIPGLLEGVGEVPADAARGAGHDGDAARVTAGPRPLARRPRPPPPSVAQGADLVGGQGAVGRAEGEPVGQGLVPVPDLVAAVDVEQRDRLEVAPAPVAQRRSTAAAGTDSSTTRATSVWASG